MQRNLLALSNARKPADVINDTVREVGRRTDKEDGVGVDKTRDGTEVDLVSGCLASNKVDLDLEVFASLAESSVGSFGEDPLNLSVSSSW